MNCYKDTPPEEYPESLTAKQYQNLEPICFYCKLDLDLYDRFTLAEDHKDCARHVAFHPDCFELWECEEEDTSNPDEPNIFVEHKL